MGGKKSTLMKNASIKIQVCYACNLGLRNFVPHFEEGIYTEGLYCDVSC